MNVLSNYVGRYRSTVPGVARDSGHPCHAARTEDSASPLSGWQDFEVYVSGHTRKVSIVSFFIENFKHAFTSMSMALQFFLLVYVYIIGNVKVTIDFLR